MHDPLDLCESRADLVVRPKKQDNDGIAVPRRPLRDHISGSTQPVKVPRQVAKLPLIYINRLIDRYFVYQQYDQSCL